MIINKITELFAKLKDGAGNLITSTDLGGGKRGLDVNVEVTAADAVSIKDAIETDDGSSVRVGHGQLHITNALPHSMPNHTKLIENTYQAIEGHNYAISTYVIPNGKNLYINKLILTSSGGENSGGIYYVEDGVYDTETIANDLLAGMYFERYKERDIDFHLVGDGTAAIVTKITRRDKGKEWVGCDWEGWIED